MAAAGRDAADDRLARGARGRPLLRPARRARGRRPVRRPRRSARGAWGVVVGTAVGATSAPRTRERAGEARGWVLGAADPLAALQALARHWRRELGAQVVGITGSTGKTSVKDICRAILPARASTPAPRTSTPRSACRWRSSRRRTDTEVLVLEMGMRGPRPDRRALRDRRARRRRDHQRRARPRRAARLASRRSPPTKAEIIDGLREDGTAVVPAEPGAARAAPRSGAPRLLRFGAGGDVEATEVVAEEGGDRRGGRRPPRASTRFKFPFVEAHNLDNALAAIAAGVALGLPAGGDGRARPGDSLLAPSWGARRAPGERHPDQRLLQRQPDLDARGAGPPRLARGGGPAARRARARCASWAPTPPPTTARSASTPASAGSSC